MKELLEGKGMHRSVNACLRDEKIVVDDRDMVFRQLNIEFNIGGSEVRCSDE